MKSISLYFQIHQPLRLRTYRFFDIGNNHNYYDDYSNESIMQKIANNCYLPVNKIMLDLLKQHKGKFKLAFSISGIALDQFEMYAPEVIHSFKKLADTGNVEFLAETYSHSLASLKNRDEFIAQIKAHHKKIEKLFGIKPKVFRNTELVYSDEIGETVASLGYTAMLTEGAKHILGWKSPNYLYYNAINPKLKILLRNYKLSDDIAFRFSNQGWKEWPLTAEKFLSWLKNIDDKEEIINLFMDYETFGEHQKQDTGIFEFLKAFPSFVIIDKTFEFLTPSEIVEKNQPVSAIHAHYPISWADEERDLTAWLGNYLQDEAFNKLYSLKDSISRVKNTKLLADWKYLQTSDHFYYMCTKFFSDGDVHSYFNPYGSPYEAFVNYMNVLSDFSLRVEEASGNKSSDLNYLQSTVEKQAKQITKYKTDLKQLKQEKSNLQIDKTVKKRVKTSNAKKTVAKRVVKKKK